ncbi:MAG: hypothetical protein JST40_09210 [Armatimonadetes bacterium]|nr:hypothetical protein [Armatimonadota bacterium]
MTRELVLLILTLGPVRWSIPPDDNVNNTGTFKEAHKVGMTAPEISDADKQLESLATVLAPLSETEESETAAQLKAKSPRFTAVEPELDSVTWETVPQAESYDLVIVDQDGSAVVRANGIQLGEDGTYTPPQPIKLKPGKNYRWKVTARVDGGTQVLTSAYAPFHVLTEAQAESVKKAMVDAVTVRRKVAIALRYGLYQRAQRLVQTLSNSEADRIPLMDIIGRARERVEQRAKILRRDS